LEVEVEETEMAVVVVKMAEALETAAAVMIMTVVLTIKVAATLVMTTAAAVTALIEVALTERVVAVYWRGRWFVSSVSDVRIMWNITSPGYLNNDRPWSSV
jgi:hypothetical protein